MFSLQKKSKSNICWRLFSSMFVISSCTFGGGFVIVSLMKKKFVDTYAWLTEEEMLDITALAQASPGAIAVNASILVGKKMAGTLGIVMAVLGTILPPLIIISLVSLIYEQFASNRYVSAMLIGMQAGVAAIICEVVLNLGKHVVHEKNILQLSIMVLSFIATYFFKVNVAIIILVCALIGVYKIFSEKREHKK